jgi:hypothetical protein
MDETSMVTCCVVTTRQEDLFSKIAHHIDFRKIRRRGGDALSNA